MANKLGGLEMSKEDTTNKKIIDKLYLSHCLTIDCMDCEKMFKIVSIGNIQECYRKNFITPIERQVKD